MRKKITALIVLLSLLLTSGIVWGDATTLSNFTPVKLPITGSIDSMVVKYDNALYISGYKGKDAYLIKCDTALKVLWELKLTSLPEIGEVYGGYIYAVSDLNVMKISLDGKLAWDVKIPASKSAFSPVEMTVVGTQVFINGFQGTPPNNTIASIMCTTEGKGIVNKIFTTKTNSSGGNHYYQGTFFFDSGNDHYVSTTDNVKFKDVTETEYYTHFSSEKRIESNMFTMEKENGKNIQHELTIITGEIVALLPNTFYEVVALDSSTAFGIKMDYSKQLYTFSTVKGVDLGSDEAVAAQPLKISSTVLANIVSPETLTKEFEKISLSYFESVDLRTASANKIAHLYENTITKIASQTVANGGTIDKATYDSAITAYDAASAQYKASMDSIFHTYKIDKLVTFNLKENNGSVVLGGDLYNKASDGILINAPEMRVTIPAETLKEIAQYGNLTLQFSKTGTSPGLTLSQKLKNPVIIGIATTNKSTDMQSLSDEKGVNIGGRYNEITGQLETRVKTSGTYSVKTGAIAFSDINTQSLEKQNAIKVLAAKGIMGGKTGTSYMPNQLVTRAELAGILLKITCLLEEGQPLFTDVKSTDWFYNIASSAKQSGLMAGTTATTFAPSGFVTKELLVSTLSTVLQKEMSLLSPVAFDSYYDQIDTNLVSTSAKTQFAFAGYEDLLFTPNRNFLDPKATLTRADVALLVYNFYINW